VKNRTSISAQERECFYQMLAALRRADPQDLRHRTDRPAGDDFSVVPLFNKPEEQIGKLVALTGTARRAILVRLDPQADADIIARFGFDHYYQVEIFTEDSQGNPLVFCLHQLPPDFPQGPNIHETLRIAGFFYKTWAYQIQQTDGSDSQGRQLAPMLLGNQAVWLLPPSKSGAAAGVIAAALFLLAMVGLFVGVWYLNRGDRKFRESTIARQLAPEPGVSLDKLGLPDNKPDFSGLG
jgi:hypothetical protein